MADSPTPQKLNVRSIISIFENQVTEPTKLQRAQSLPRLDKTRSTNQIVRSTNLEFEQIAQQIQHLKKNLDNYRNYSRENHVYYQNQIIFILIDVANLANCDPELKMELSERLKSLNKLLNLRLPAVEGVTTRFEPKRPKSVQEEKEVAKNKEITDTKKKEKVVPPVDEEKDDTPISVKSLKQLFEKNSNENEAKREFPKAKLTRSLTFNTTNDFKYIPYGDRFKHEGILKKQVSFNDHLSGKIAEEMSLDSLSGEESDEASNSGSDQGEGF